MAGVIENTLTFVETVILLLGGVVGSAVEDLEGVAMKGIAEKSG